MIFTKKYQNHLAVSKIMYIFALAFKKHGSVAQLNRASDYGSEGSGFESQRSHKVFQKGLHKRLKMRKRMLFVNILFFCILQRPAAADGIHFGLT